MVQEASHWLTVLLLVESGLGVSVAVACLQRSVRERSRNRLSVESVGPERGRTD
jgi:hypothetical protein